MSLFSSRIAAESLRRLPRTKSEGGQAFGPRDYAYVPDPSRPETWRLRLADEPGGGPVVARVEAAVKSVAARPERAGVDRRDVPVVKRRLAHAHRVVEVGDALPAGLEKAGEELGTALTSATSVAKDCCYDPCREWPSLVLFTDEVDGHQHSLRVSMDPESYEFHGGWLSHATSEGAENSHGHEWRWGPGGTIEITMSSGHRHSVDLSAVLSELVGAPR